jgi:hypothetical protein
VLSNRLHTGLCCYLKIQWLDGQGRKHISLKDQLSVLDIDHIFIASHIMLQRPVSPVQSCFEHIGSDLHQPVGVETNQAESVPSAIYNS